MLLGGQNDIGFCRHILDDEVLGLSRIHMLQALLEVGINSGRWRFTSFLH